MKKFYPINKIKAALNIILSLAVLGACMAIQILDSGAMAVLDVINYITMILAFYFALLFGFDLFSKKSGLTVDDAGIHINYGYFKNIILEWEHVTGIVRERFFVTVQVDDTERYLSKLPFITRMLIGPYRKSYHTIFILRGYMLNVKNDELFTVLENGKKQSDRG
ncbi:MAG: STM3941 family protein [Spirochaetota bacterium]